MTEAATTSVQPSRMSGDQAKPKGNSAWVRGGPSPNPNGRPKGIVDRRMKVTQALEDDAPAIARVVIEAALEGDMQAAALVLSRVAPTLRSQSQKVNFDFDPSGSISQQVEQILRAVSTAAISPDVGKQVIDAVQTLSAIRTAEELETRIAQLEERQS